MSAPSTASAANELGRYTLERRIASGGMADVFLATQKGAYGFSKRVAVKLLKSEVAADDENVKMFIREALVCAEFRHPNLAQVYEVGEHEGQLFIAMELVRGLSVSALLRGLAEKGKGMPFNVALRIAIDALEGLAHAHEAASPDGKILGLVHRDVSPQNILVGVDGVAKVVDFGIARAEMAFGKTIAPKIKGKLSYMSPEQWEPNNSIDGRADLFALGIVLYEMTTGGTRLFRADTPRDMYKAIVMDPIPDPRSRLPDYPEGLAAIVMRALERGVGARWPSARAMRNALVEYAQTQNWSISSRAVADTVRTAVGTGEIEWSWEPVGPGAREARADPDARTVVDQHPGAALLGPAEERRARGRARMMVGSAGAVLLAAATGFAGYAMGNGHASGASAAVGPLPSASGEPVSGVVRVKAVSVSGAWEPRAIVEKFTEAHPGSTLRWESADSAGAMAALVRGDCDVAIALRAPTDEEVSRARANAVDLGEGARTVVGRAIAVVAVNPHNPDESLPESALAGIFRGQITQWNAVGPDNGPVRLVARPDATELLALANASLLSGAPRPTGVEVAATDDAAAALVGADQHAITVLALSVAERRGSALRMLGGAGERSFPVTAVTRGEPRGVVRALLDWLRAPDVAPMLRRESVVPPE